MKAVLILILTFSIGLGVAQSIFPQNLLEDQNNSLVIRSFAEGFYQGQGLTNRFIDKFIYGGHISDELKQEVESQLKTEENRMGLCFRTGIKFYDLSDSLFKGKHWGISIGLEHQQLITTSFTQDLFHAVFFGNADRIGQDLNMGPTRLSAVQFQSLKFNLVNKKNHCEFGFSVVKGQSNITFNADQFRLSTEADLSEITLVSQASLFQSNTNSTGFFAGNGIGAALNAVYFIPIKSLSGKQKAKSDESETEKVTIGHLKFEIDNFGFINWMSDPSIYQTDSTYNYSGFEIQDLFNQDISNLVDTEVLTDSLLPTRQKSPYNTILPAVFSVSFEPTADKNNSISGMAGAWYQIMANARPVVYGGVRYRLNERFSGAIVGLVGGYATINAGLKLTYSGSKIGAVIATNNLIGMVSKNGNGRHLNFGVICKF